MSRLYKTAGLLLLVIVIGVALVLGPFRRQAERFFVVQLGDVYELPEGALGPIFDGPDSDRDQLTVALVEVASGLPQLTDLQFVPGAPDTLVVARKTGELVAVDLTSGERQLLGQFDVLTDSEQGLLGVTFDPRTPGVLYTNTVEAGEAGDVTRIRRCTFEGAIGPVEPSTCRILFEIGQPYQNHNAGQLAFGPDGRLYVGLGDGGLRNDPLRAGQDPTTLLGSMITLDPERGWLAEIWAMGFRNPWRFSFTPDGRLVVADVGQKSWEEITLVGPGSNAGWSILEGRSCFREDPCDREGLTEPVHVYGRDEGVSVTGGYVVTDDGIPQLQGRYVFGDFVSGRIWALDLSGDGKAEPLALGRWPLLISTFGRDAQGRLYVGDYARGVVYRMVRGG